MHVEICQRTFTAHSPLITPEICAAADAQPNFWKGVHEALIRNDEYLTDPSD